MRGINSSNDLLKTMHIGNELYSSLSQLARQSFLMLTELPTMLTVLDENYQLDYSASYTGKYMVIPLLMDFNIVWDCKELCSL